MSISEFHARDTEHVITIPDICRAMRADSPACRGRKKTPQCILGVQKESQKMLVCTSLFLFFSYSKVNFTNWSHSSRVQQFILLTDRLGGNLFLLRSLWQFNRKDAVQPRLVEQQKGRKGGKGLDRERRYKDRAEMRAMGVGCQKWWWWWVMKYSVRVCLWLLPFSPSPLSPSFRHLWLTVLFIGVPVVQGTHLQSLFLCTLSELRGEEDKEQGRL